MPSAVFVHAPSRLHFGLLLPQAGARRFGGVGAMIDRPGVRLKITRASSWQTHGPLAERIEAFARRWAAYHGLSELPRCRIDVEGAPRQHIGLGVGTQLGLSLAAGLCALFDLPQPPPEELAESVGRGRRSAIGTHGFALGGLLADRGKAAADRVAPLAWRAALPDAWRFVILCPRAGHGVSGEVEERAFAALPAAPPQTIARLQSLSDEMRTAAESGDFNRFSQAVYGFGRASGECFAAAQGGVYASANLAHWVERLRSWGVEGIGQSSWGPTLFALAMSSHNAESLARRIAAHDEQADWTPMIAAPQNTGATVCVIA
jgi:beta-RFAP synthase